MRIKKNFDDLRNIRQTPMIKLPYTRYIHPIPTLHTSSIKNSNVNCRNIVIQISI